MKLGRPQCLQIFVCRRGEPTSLFLGDLFDSFPSDPTTTGSVGQGASRTGAPALDSDDVDRRPDGQPCRARDPRSAPSRGHAVEQHRASGRDDPAPIAAHGAPNDFGRGAGGDAGSGRAAGQDREVRGLAGPDRAGAGALRRDVARGQEVD